MARRGDKDVAAQIKLCFKQFDKDGNGAISRAELQEVLERLSGESLSRKDIDKCIAQADKNRNGVIEYEEFVDWLMTPGAQIQASTNGAALFDLETVLLPLFQVFDRNGNGVISSSEFEECFCILQNALSMCGTSLPRHMRRDAAEVFCRADSSSDCKLSFEEFVSWQRDALKGSGLLNEDLKDLVPALARQLERIFKISEAEEKGHLNEEDQEVERIILERIIGNVATFARDIWNEEHLGTSSLHGRKHYPNRWSDPPVGLNVERLLRKHLTMARPQQLRGATLQIVDHSHFELHALCVPELLTSNSENPAKRQWVARVTQGHLALDTKADASHYVFSDLSWEEGPDACEVFNRAYESFSTDMRFFCLLKTQANFGVKISWANTQVALKDGVDLGLLTAEQHKKFNERTRAHVLGALEGRRLSEDLSDDELALQVQDTLDNRLHLSPKSVMAALLDMGVFEVSSKLADAIAA